MTPDSEILLNMQQAFGYNREDVKFFLDPMADKGEDPIGSMDDIPLASLSDKPRMLYDYFFQNLHVTNADRSDPRATGDVLVSFIGRTFSTLDPAASICGSKSTSRS